MTPKELIMMEMWLYTVMTVWDLRVFTGGVIDSMSHERNTVQWKDHRACSQKMLVFALVGSSC